MSNDIRTLPTCLGKLYEEGDPFCTRCLDRRDCQRHVAEFGAWRGNMDLDLPTVYVEGWDEVVMEYAMFRPVLPIWNPTEAYVVPPLMVGEKGMCHSAMEFLTWLKATAAENEKRLVSPQQIQRHFWHNLKAQGGDPQEVFVVAMKMARSIVAFLVEKKVLHLLQVSVPPKEGHLLSHGGTNVSSHRPSTGSPIPSSADVPPSNSSGGSTSRRMRRRTKSANASSTSEPGSTTTKPVKRRRRRTANRQSITETSK